MQAAQIAATIATITARDEGDNEDPSTELDYHTNMVVLGAHAFIFESTNRTCNFQPFDPSLGTASKIPSVDGAVVYKCLYIITYTALAKQPYSPICNEGCRSHS